MQHNSWPTTLIEDEPSKANRHCWSPSNISPSKLGLHVATLPVGGLIELGSYSFGTVNSDIELIKLEKKSSKSSRQD